MRSQTLLLIVLACTVVAVTGCDAGYSYKPVSPTGELVARSSESIGKTNFSMGTYKTSTSSRSILQNLFIDNGSDKDITVLDAALETGGKTIPAKIYSGAEGEQERTSRAKYSKSVGLLFSFGEPASEVLAKDIVWVWQLRIGEEEYVVRVPMRRE